MKGSKLEGMVRHSAERLKDKGLYLVQSSPRFVGRVGKAGEASGRLVGVGGLDFQGDLNGRAVLFDCKSTIGKTAFRLDLIKPHQALIVRRAHERGAIAFFLVEFSALADGPRYFALTWPVLAPWWRGYQGSRYGGGNAPSSVPLTIIEQSCTEIGRRQMTLDLVSAVEVIAHSPAIDTTGRKQHKGERP